MLDIAALYPHDIHHIYTPTRIYRVVFEGNIEDSCAYARSGRIVTAELFDNTE